MTQLNGHDVGQRLFIHEFESATFVWSDTVPARSTFIVYCSMVSESGFADDNATLASAHVNALRVGALNP